jgi:hypothetical protein
MKYLLMLLYIIGLLVSTMLGQSVYPIPFASQDNKIELVVANSSTRTAEEVKIEVTHTPAWLKFQSKLIALSTLKSKEEYTALFSFSVEKTAVVNKEQTLSYTISTKNGESWKKEIKISIAPPATYELFQNYPNPFNPTTTIEYLLPGVETRFIVSLKVYDILGREVVALVNEQQEPGYHQTTLDARSLSSGTYIYQLIATDEQNNRYVFSKAMILVK